MQAADATLRSQSFLDTKGASLKDEPVAGSKQNGCQTYPDLGLVQADDGGGWATLDVMLTVPERDWLRTMLGRGHRDRLIRAQLFLVQDAGGESETLIETVAEDLGLADRVHVKKLASDGIAGARPSPAHGAKRCSGQAAPF